MAKIIKKERLHPSFDEFSEIVSKLTGGRVDASVAKDSYDREDMQKPVPLLCRVHNEIYSRRPDSLLQDLKRGRKCGCYKCHHGELGKNTPMLDGRPDWNKILEYHTDGSLTWKMKPAAWIEKGESAANYCDKMGYWKVTIGGKKYLAHVIVWEMHNGPVPDGMQVDHIDHDPSNMRIENLRLVDNTENHHNCSLYCNNKHGVPGISHHESKSGNVRFRATIKVKYKLIELGWYDDWFEAVCARKSAQNLYRFHSNCGKSKEKKQ